MTSAGQRGADRAVWQVTLAGPGGADKDWEGAATLHDFHLHTLR